MHFSQFFGLVSFTGSIVLISYGFIKSWNINSKTSDQLDLSEALKRRKTYQKKISYRFVTESTEEIV